ncbi:MAG: RAMP superfamily CRISPR-associated protein, partial [Hydrogenophilus thermoluteolus]
MMQTATFTLTFTTPAFLGDANQNARWRTPPIKHELRHWWRVAYAADHGFRVNVSEMRREEGLLFGHAWLENDAFVQDGRKTKTAARQSQVRIRLDHWNEGMLRQWPQDTTVTHPSVRMPIGSTLYLGYGPLTFNRNSSKTALKANAAIQEQEQATLAIAYPEATASLLEQALWLMDRFGTLGGRARNGWGSYHL